MVNYVYVATFSGNLISFIAGTAITWSSPSIPKLNDTETTPFGRTITDDESSWIGSLLALGAVLGPYIYGQAADHFGRKITLTSLGFPFIIAYLMLSFSKIIPLFYAARVLMGIAVGGVFTVIPMYVGEIAEDSNRGALGSSMNCFITAGLLFSYVLGPYTSIMIFNLILAIFPLIFIVGFIFLAPETPHHFISKDLHEYAEKSLSKLRGHSNVNNAKELEIIKQGVQSAGKGTIIDIFKSKGLIKATLISMALVGFQQFSGINVVLFYAQDVFAASGSTIPAEISSIIIGVVQFGASFLTPLLADRLGRRILLIISAIGMAVSEIPLGLYFFLKNRGENVDAISWLPVVALVIYIIAYNCGFGPLPWAVMGELFPSNIKSIASSMTACFCWFLGFLITKFFNSITGAIGIGPSFWLFSGFCLLGLLFCIFFLIETKGKNPKEIQDILNG